MKKTASVYTNDKNHPVADLTMSGDVDRFVTIQPPSLRLSGFAGEPLKGSVTIIPEKRYPFKIINVRAKDGQYITFQLKETTQSEATAYELKVENLKQDTGRYFDSIILETDSKIQPQLDVRVYGYLLPRKGE
jgi:hypothetical protein